MIPQPVYVAGKLGANSLKARCWQWLVHVKQHIACFRFSLVLARCMFSSAARFPVCCGHQCLLQLFMATARAVVFRTL